MQCSCPQEGKLCDDMKKNGCVKDHLSLALEVHLIFDCYRLTKASHFTIIHDKELECYWVLNLIANSFFPTYKGILKLVTEVHNKTESHQIII